MTWFRRVLLLGVVAGVWMPPVTGRACSYPAPGLFVPESVPSNGAVHLQKTCGYEACSSAAFDGLEVLDVATGEPVSGKLLDVGLTWSSTAYWKADSALEVGREYAVRAADSASLAIAQLPRFTVSAAVVLDVDAVVVTATLHRTEQPGSDAIDCTGPSDSCGGHPVVHTQRRWLADVQLQSRLAGDDPALSTQYVTYTTFRDADGAAVNSFWSRGFASFSFEQRDAEYCYDVVVHSLIDSSEATHSGCVPHGELGELGEEDLSEQELLEALVRCDGVADAEDRDLWCKAQLEACAGIHGDDALLVCNPRIEACGGQPLAPVETAPDAGEPVAPAAHDDASVPTLDDGFPDEAADGFEDDAKKDPSAAACSVTQPGQSSGNALFAVVVLLLLTLRVLVRARPQRP